VFDCFCSQQETHTNRLATQHDWLPSLLGDGGKCIEIVNGEEKLFFTGTTKTAKEGQKYLVNARQAQRTILGRTLTFALFESPFTSVSTVSRGPLLYIGSLPCAANVWTAGTLA
jgi:hypothetical protein